MLDPVDRRTDDQADMDDFLRLPGLYGVRLLVSDDRQPVLGGVWMSELVLAERLLEGEDDETTD